MSWLSAALILLLFVPDSRAASIQARLIRASNEKEAQDERVKDLVPKLKPVFGYEHYKQLGFQKQPLKDKQKVTLDLGEGFFVFVTPKSVENKTHKLDVELVSGKAIVMKATLEVGEKKPLMIKGPEVGSTLMIVSLSVTD
jgi:hypothetical protein